MSSSFHTHMHTHAMKGVKVLKRCRGHLRCWASRKEVETPSVRCIAALRAERVCLKITSARRTRMHTRVSCMALDILRQRGSSIRETRPHYCIFSCSSEKSDSGWILPLMLLSCLLIIPLQAPVKTEKFTCTLETLLLKTREVWESRVTLAQPSYQKNMSARD